MRYDAMSAEHIGPRVLDSTKTIEELVTVLALNTVFTQGTIEKHLLSAINGLLEAGEPLVDDE